MMVLWIRRGYGVDHDATPCRCNPCTELSRLVLVSRKARRVSNLAAFADVSPVNENQPALVAQRQSVRQKEEEVRILLVA